MGGEPVAVGKSTSQLPFRKTWLAGNRPGALRENVRHASPGVPHPRRLNPLVILQGLPDQDRDRVVQPTGAGRHDDLRRLSGHQNACAPTLGVARSGGSVSRPLGAVRLVVRSPLYLVSAARPTSPTDGGAARRRPLPAADLRARRAFRNSATQAPGPAMPSLPT